MWVFEFKNKEIQIGTTARANRELEFEGQASLRRHLSWFPRFKPRILKSNEFLQPFAALPGREKKIGSIFCLPHYLPAGSQDSNEWWDLPLPAWCVCVCTLAFLLGELVFCWSKNITRGLDHHKRWVDEEYYLPFHIIIHNAGVIDPRTCGFISSC